MKKITIYISIMLNILLIVLLITHNLYKRKYLIDLYYNEGMISTISAALNGYAIDNNNYPSNQQNLKALYIKPANLNNNEKWNGPYLQGNLKDLERVEYRSSK